MRDSFLLSLQCNGNVEECYQKLRTGEWTDSDMYDPHQLPDLLPQLPDRSNTLSGHHSIHPTGSHERRLHRTRTYGPDKSYHGDRPQVKNLSSSLSASIGGWYRQTNAGVGVYPSGLSPSTSGIYTPFQAPTTGKTCVVSICVGVCGSVCMCVHVCVYETMTE